MKWWIWMPGFFISNGRCGEESKTAERQRKRLCERQSIAGRRG
jgi:hypothetical protein